MRNEPDTRHRTLRRILLTGMQKGPVLAKATLRQERERLVTTPVHALETGSFRALKTSSYATHDRDFPRPPPPKQRRRSFCSSTASSAPPSLLPHLRRTLCSSAASTAPPPLLLLLCRLQFNSSTPTEARKPDALRDLQGLYGEDVPFMKETLALGPQYAQHSGESTYFPREFLRRLSSSQDAARH